MEDDVLNLPDDKGSYVLVMHVPELRRIEIGQFGTFDIRPGYYAYVESAFGAGGSGGFRAERQGAARGAYR